MNRDQPVADYRPDGIAILRPAFERFCEAVSGIRVQAVLIVADPRGEINEPRMVECRICGDRYRHGWFGYVDVGICADCALPFQRISVRAFRAHCEHTDWKSPRDRCGSVGANSRVIEQVMLDGKWVDLARTVGDHRPTFRYGRPWQEHVPTHSRHLIRDSA